MLHVNEHEHDARASAQTPAPTEKAYKRLRMVKSKMNDEQRPQGHHAIHGAALAQDSAPGPAPCDDFDESGFNWQTGEWKDDQAVADEWARIKGQQK